MFVQSSVWFCREVLSPLFIVARGPFSNFIYVKLIQWIWKHSIGCLGLLGLSQYDKMCFLIRDVCVAAVSLPTYFFFFFFLPHSSKISRAAAGDYEK